MRLASCRHWRKKRDSRSKPSRTETSSSALFRPKKKPETLRCEPKESV